jgi:hypothetical protein
MSDWTDAIVGERMAVDQEFNDQVAASRFSNQEWGLIMTATEFDIENASDPDEARIVAETSSLPQILPELGDMREQMAAMGGGGGNSGGSGGVIESLKDALGLGGSSDGVDQEELQAAEQLVQQYADQLQEHLESRGKWEQVRVAYQE